MAYCTLQHLIDSIGEIELAQRSSRTGSGSIDMDVVEKAISDACAEIDSYLPQQPTPMTVITPRLVSIAVDITVYYLYRGVSNEDVTNRYNAAISFVKQVNKGQATFGADTSGTVAETSTGLVEVVTTPRLFGRRHG